MISPNDKLTIYSAKRNYLGSGNVWKDMFKDIMNSRDLIWRLILRDISVRYRQSILGYIWAVLPQIVTVAIFAFLARYRVFDMGQTSMPYVIHALWSLSVWQLFSSCLLGCTNSLVNAGSLVTKINFTKEALVIASIGQGCVDFLIRLIPVFAVFLWHGFIPSWKAVAIPIVLLFVILMAIGMGFFLAIINLVLRDVGNALGMLLTFGMFLSPILYAPPIREPFVLINYANPFSPLLIATQDLLMGADLKQPILFLFIGFLSIILFFVGWFIFHVVMPRVTERA